MSNAVTNPAALSVNARIHADGVTVSYDDHDAGERDEVTVPTRDHARALVGLVRMAEAAGLEIVSLRACRDGRNYSVNVDVEAEGAIGSLSHYWCRGTYGANGFAYTGSTKAQGRIRATLRNRILTAQDRAEGYELGDMLADFIPAT